MLRSLEGAKNTEVITKRGVLSALLASKNRPFVKEQDSQNAEQCEENMRTQARPNSENRVIKDINLLKVAKALGPDGVLAVAKHGPTLDCSAGDYMENMLLANESRNM
jgi:hypothetical protein